MTGGGTGAFKRKKENVGGKAGVVAKGLLLLMVLMEERMLALGKDVHSCNSNQFPCDDQTCIDSNWVCDGQMDCSNGEDEFCDQMGGSTSTTTPSPSGRKGLGHQSNSCEIPKTDSAGTVHSPNFPLIYEENFSCDYVFIAEPNTRIQLNFTFFNLECSTCACCDVLELRQTTSSSNTPRVDRHCCSDNPDVFTSDNNVLIMRFYTRPTDSDLLPEDALVLGGDRKGVEGALGRAQAGGWRHGFEVTYTHIIKDDY